MSALGISPARETAFSVHGYEDVFMNISPSGNHFEDINILGGDFFQHTSIIQLPLYHKREIYFFKNRQMVMEWVSSNEF